MFKNVKAVLLDLDGTVIESIDLIVECWATAFKNQGINVSTEEIYGDVGLPARTIFEKHVRTFNEKLYNIVRGEATTCFENKKDKYKLLHESTVKVLKKLREKNILLGLVTSSSCKRTYKILRELGLDNLFDTIKCLEGDLRGKPYPDLILHALKDLQCQPSDAIYVGDTIYDCLAAKNAGVKFVLLKKKWSNQAQMNDECIPVKIIKDLSELLN
ncbi:MAG: HAD-IA family hydrolase [Staphylothermus sp.]|nr:HAD-IA family hydrolase [Staphylothermus sp.]